MTPLPAKKRRIVRGRVGGVKEEKVRQRRSIRITNEEEHFHQFSMTTTARNQKNKKRA